MVSCLTKSEIQLIDRYLHRELSIEELNNTIERKLTLLETYDLLDFYLDNKDHTNFWRTLWIMPKSYSTNEKLILFTKYLLEDGHEEHEEMIGVLFDYTDIKGNISLLKTLIENTPQYFYKTERKYVFINKCFSILKKYKFLEAEEAIKSIFRTTEDETIKKMAKYIIDNNK